MSLAKRRQKLRLRPFLLEFITPDPLYRYFHLDGIFEKVDWNASWSKNAVNISAKLKQYSKILQHIDRMPPDGLDL